MAFLDRGGGVADPMARRRPTTDNEPSASRLPRWLVLALPVALAILAYANSLDGGFVWDDRSLIVEDPAIKSPAYLAETLTNDFFYRHEDDVPYGYYRPLVSLSYALDYAVWKLEPFGYHLTNVLIHGACTLAAVLCLLALGLARGSALAAGALFATHPVHTENVAWIAGRTDLLAFLFTALALWLHLRARPGFAETVPKRRASRPGTGAEEARVSRATLAAAAVFFALGLLAKEMSVVLLAWIPLLHHFWLGETWRRALRAALPYGLVAGAYAAWRFGVIAVAPPGDSAGQPLLAVLASVPHTLARYLGWLILPLSPNAYVQNPYVTNAADWRLWAGVALLVALGVAGWRLRSQRPRAVALGTMVLVSFLPVLNVARLAGPPDMGGVMAERFCYFPSFPFLALVGLGFGILAGSLSGRPVLRRALVVGVASVVVLAAAASAARNRVWSDEETFLRSTLERSPGAYLLWGNLANHYIQEHRLAEADAALRRAEVLGEELWSVRSGRVYWYIAQQRYEEALERQREIVAGTSLGRARTRNNLAFLYRMTGRTDEAKEILLDLVRKGRVYPDVHINLAEIYRVDGSPGLARVHYGKALAGSPHKDRIARRLASLEVEQGNLDAAVAVLERQLRLEPRNADLRNDLALAHYREGDAEAALDELERLVSDHPRYARGRLNYGHVLLQSGRRDEGRRQLEQAAEMAAGTPLGELARQRLAALDRPQAGGENSLAAAAEGGES